MPDIEKLKINWLTAFGFAMSAFGVVFMAGFYFFEMKENTRLLREYIKKDEQRSVDMNEVKTRLLVIETYLHVDSRSFDGRDYGKGARP